jgi:DNA polymerase delta subunit 1
VYSSNTNFPKASEPLNVITHIGLTLKWTTEADFSEYICLTLGECDIIDENFKLEMDPLESNIPIRHLIYKTEKELLIGLNEIFQKYDPDIVLTFNGDLFDYEYIYARMLFNDITSQMTRFVGKNDEYFEMSFDSKAHGKTDFTRLDIPGRIQHDILISIKKDYKLRNYKLNTIAKEFLGQEKIDMSYNDMFKAFREKDSKLNREVAIYCIQDVRLNQLLYDHCKFLQGNIQLSNIVWVPYSFLITRGEQIKVMSLILKETLDLDFVIPNIISYKMEYEGATVLNPKRCGVYSGPIITLDFASLYPSIMMAQNLCYMTIVLDKKYLNLPGYDYVHLEWDYEYIDKDTKQKQVNHISLDYVTNIIGLSPKILKRVGESRKATKREMKTIKDKNSFEYVVLDKRQLGYKLVMNSYYGFMAAQKLSCPEISATVTYYGRKMIEQVQNWVDTNVKGAESIYGDTDSVFIDIFASKHLKNPIRNKEIKQKELEEALIIGPKLADEITKLFKDPIKLEFEKVYGGVGNFILLSKKKYIGPLYTRPEKYDKIDSKGNILKKRDTFFFQKKLYKGIVDMILWKENPVVEIENYITKEIDRLLNGEIKLKDLIYTKNYRGDYKNPENNIQQVIVDKITKRNPIEAPKTNERINYCYVKAVGAKLEAHRVEDPKYVEKYNIPIDYHHYIEKISKPVCDLLSDTINDPKKIFYKYKDIGYKRKHPGEDPKQKKICFLPISNK